jgi:RNA polymerase sigma factor (sigma-70 family)
MDQENYSEFADDRLLQLMIEGDQSAFSIIYKRHWSALYNAAFKRLKDHSHAHDILQNVFIDLWTRRTELKVNNLIAYLQGAVRFQVYKIVQKEQRHSTFFDSFNTLFFSPLCDEGILDKELRELFNLWILALPEKRRQIFKMHHEMHLPTNEIARQLNISQKTVQNQLNRASIALRSRLTKLVYFIVLICLPSLN